MTINNYAYQLVSLNKSAGNSYIKRKIYNNEFFINSCQWKGKSIMADFNNKVWISDQGDGTYINPILHADYSDPDVIRVDDDFFMVASSFNCTPGLPILHSRDLVNWQLVNYAINNIELPGYDLPAHGCGIWAPSIRYHNNKFWICVGLPDEGIFMTVSEDPFGDWSPLYCIKPGKGFIDPCPFWDDDGKAFLVHAFAASRSGIKSKLMLQEMAADGSTVLGEGRIIFDGTTRHPTLEGPKMYKRSGYYYIMAPAGGVTRGWQTVLRSKTVWGPYEDKIVLHQGNTNINGPHQGGWVELKSGESWFVHFQDCNAYGRIVHLQPVKWVDDWPLMGINQDEAGVGEPVIRFKKPNVEGKHEIKALPTTDLFDGELGLMWQWFANHKDDWYSIREKGLRLFTQNISHSLKTMWGVPNILAQKFPAPSFTATAKLSFNPKQSTEKSGIVITGENYSYLALSRGNEEWILERYIGSKNHKQDQLIASVKLDSNTVFLKVVIKEYGLCLFQYSTDGEHYHTMSDEFQAVKGRWIGAKIGLFSVDFDDSDVSKGWADFAWFKVEEAEE